MNHSIITLDNFYHDADLVREFALQQEYSVGGNYPGKRTQSFKEGQVMEGFEEMLGFEIDKDHWNASEYTGCFQSVTGDRPHWIHADPHDDYAAVIFLTPDPPLQTGTSFYRHKKSKSIRANIVKGFKDKESTESFSTVKVSIL